MEYGGSLLLRSVQGETTLYAGRVDGKEAVFAVSPDGRVTYRFDGGDYGPYIVVEDPGAVPGPRYGRCAHRCGGAPRG